jgi:hypothetical protein
MLVVGVGHDCNGVLRPIFPGELCDFVASTTIERVSKPGMVRIEDHEIVPVDVSRR